MAECTFSESTTARGCWVPEDIGVTYLNNAESSKLVQMLQDLVDLDGFEADGHGDPICFLTILAFGEHRANSSRDGGAEYHRMFMDIKALLDVIASEE